ncbi:hypothetical protein JW977_01160 [Candidatus Falkowbacteria bacterium]|nr:hypothetical protein [Candidatus Falkowbacteria bacterium]
MNKKLRNKILSMAKKDQKMRRSGKWDFLVDKKNTAELKKIIESYGWPDIPLVGKIGSMNAWLIAQHADHDLKFQKKCLKLMEKKLKEKKIELQYYPYLKDRVLVNSGKTQIFGTQFYHHKTKGLVPRPIYDIKNIDRRRKKYKLGPFEEYRKHIQNLKK